MSDRKFYLDSSENASDEPECALSWHETIEQARAAAQEAAVKNPGTLFFVNEVISTYKCIYRAEATVSLETEILDSAK